jgi:hypothetical protein
VSAETLGKSVERPFPGAVPGQAGHGQPFAQTPANNIRVNRQIQRGLVMKRITYLAAIAAGILALAAPALAASESFTGNVKAVSGSSITVERGTLTGVFTVTGKTQVSVHGATAKTKEARAAGKPGLTIPDAVHLGDQVTVKYVEQGSSLVAADIIVRVSLAK